MTINLPSSLFLTSVVDPYLVFWPDPERPIFRWGNRNRDCIASLRACNGQAVRFSLSVGVHRLFASYFRPARRRRRRLFLFPARVRRVPNVLGAFPPISRPFQNDYYGLLLIIAAIVIYTVLPMCCLFIYFILFIHGFPHLS